MTNQSLPKYKQIQHYITTQIDDGAWPVGSQIPTDVELTEKFKVARMTVVRAMQELADQGRLNRVQGGGTFVADAPQHSTLLEIPNIRADIEGRGHQYSCSVHLLGEEPASRIVANSMEIEKATPVWHSKIVHYEDSWPVQLENKFVVCDFAPDYLKQDFTSITPSAYLLQCGPLEKVEHIVEAVIPDSETQELLMISDREPCLLLRRRTWSNKRIVSKSWLVHPGSRYRLGAVFAGN